MFTNVNGRNKKVLVLGWLLTLVMVVATALLVRAYVFGIILIEGPSMQPTLYTNERLAVEKVSRYFGLPHRGDIVIVTYPGEEGSYVKRVVGLPGEQLEIRDSTVYIDGQPLDEPYTSETPYADMEAVSVPDDHIFVMGDNRANSWDSRKPSTGPISKDAVIGHALLIVYPFNMLQYIA